VKQYDEQLPAFVELTEPSELAIWILKLAFKAGDNKRLWEGGPMQFVAAYIHRTEVVGILKAANAEWGYDLETELDEALYYLFHYTLIRALVVNFDHEAREWDSYLLRRIEALEAGDPMPMRRNPSGPSFRLTHAGKTFLEKLEPKEEEV
jgi:hypothetical protein